MACGLGACRLRREVRPDGRQSIDDTNLTAAVKARLARDEISSLFRIDVDTKVSIVTLTGNVRTPDQIKHVEGIAREVKGVKDVVNKLQVQPR